MAPMTICGLMRRACHTPGRRILRVAGRGRLDRYRMHRPESDGRNVTASCMHADRIAHSANARQMWTDSVGRKPFDMHRSLELSEIPSVIGEYAEATRNALAAGSLAKAIAAKRIAYLHVMRTGIEGERAFREAFPDKLPIGGAYVKEEATRDLAPCLTGAMVFGPLNEPSQTTFYPSGERDTLESTLA